MTQIKNQTMKRYLYLILAAITSFSVIACDDDEATAEILADRDTINAALDGEEITVSVTSNAQWIARVDDAENNIWCTLKDAAGERDGQFTVNIAANYHQQERNATITIYAGKEKFTIAVNQAKREVSAVGDFNFDFASLVCYNYYGDTFDKGTGHVRLQFITENFDAANTPTGSGCILSLDCFIDMPEDPTESIPMPVGTYGKGSVTEAGVLTFAVDSDNTFAYIYDDNLRKSAFNISDGSFEIELNGGKYHFTGTFIGEDGNKLEWTAEAIFSLTNYNHLDVSPDGYKILKSGSVVRALYEGNIDGYGTGKVTLEVRDKNRGDGLFLVFYTDKSADADNATITPGEYTIKSDGSVGAIVRGDSDPVTSEVTGSFSVVNGTADTYISGGSFVVAKTGNTYDIKFDLEGDGPSGSVALNKYRYKGPITLDNATPQTITYSITSVEFKHIGDVAATGTGEYDIILHSGANYTVDSHHTAFRHFGNPKGGGTATPTLGTYKLSPSNSKEMFTFAPSNVTNFYGPSGSYYRHFGNPMQVITCHGFTGGTLKIENGTNAGEYKVSVDVVTEYIASDFTTRKGLIEFVYDGPVPK